LDWVGFFATPLAFLLAATLAALLGAEGAAGAAGAAFAASAAPAASFSCFCFVVLEDCFTLTILYINLLKI
jgi:hypothetical protein